MYTEEYEAKGFVLRKFLLKLVFVVIFIFLLIWLVPKTTYKKVENVDKQELSPINEEVFSENLSKMQQVGVDYYTATRLPKEVGEKEQMTLSEMITKKLIVPLVDQNDNACDGKKSYVRVTKLSEEYLMKINLKCSKKEDYVLVHMGKFEYCDSDICAKKDTEIAVEKSKPKKMISFGNRNSSSKSSSSGSSSLPPANSEIEEPTVTTPEALPGYQYEYQKTTGAKYSNWSRWSNWERASCDTVAYGCDDNSPSCVKKLQTYRRKEKVGTYDKEYVATRSEFRQTNTYEQQVCANYDYISYNNTLYVVTVPYTTINYVTNANQASVTGWKYEGRKSYATPPNDTLTTRYKFVQADFSGCGNTCSTAPKKIYDVYTYTGQIGAVSSAVSSQNITTLANKSLNVNCVGTTKKTVSIYGAITTYEKAVRKEPLYGTVCYQSIKTRNVMNQGKTETKWSSYNDTSLLNSGYHYTGNKRG